MVNIEYLHLLTPSLPRNGDMNQYESEGPPIRPVLGSLLIHLLIQLLLTASPLCSKKSPRRVSRQRLTNTASMRSRSFLQQGMRRRALESTYFWWHFRSHTLLCKYQYNAVTVTWLKSLVLLFLLFPLYPFISPWYILFLSWGSVPNKAALFTWIMRPQWVL